MYPIWKRALDILLSSVAVVLLLPLFLILCIAVLADSGFPILFRQERVGRHKRPFAMMKFRTMRQDAPHDMPTHLLADPDQYITRVGRVLRRTAMDELPQLFHILSGRMSFIGPRPALWNQTDLIVARDAYHDAAGCTVNDLRPGLSGWAQVNGRDELPIGEKARLDGEYLLAMSFRMDWRCFWRTAVCALNGHGYREGGRQEAYHDKQ